MLRRIGQFIGIIALLVIYVPISVMVGAYVFWRLPSVVCSWRRAVRWLPLFGLAWYPALFGLFVVVKEPPLWVMAVFAWLALYTPWLLPDPITFLFRPRRRRAIRAAIEHIEATNSFSVDYGKTTVMAEEPDRVVVSVMLYDLRKPQGGTFAAVDDGGSVRELSWKELDPALRGDPIW